MDQSRDPSVIISHSPSSPIVSVCQTTLFVISLKVLIYSCNFNIFCCLKGDDLEAELEKAAHCMQFAAAAYGWPLYIFSNPLTGACKLSGDW